MTALLIFVCYLLLDKVMDICYQMYQLRVQERVQMTQMRIDAEVEEEPEKKEIGFNTYGNTLKEVDEDDE